MANASNSISPSAINDNEKEMKNETTTSTNGHLETNRLPEAENPLNLAEVPQKDGKSTMLENGQQDVSLNDEKKYDKKDDSEKPIYENLNEKTLDDNLKGEYTAKVDERREHFGDKMGTIPASNGNDGRHSDVIDNDGVSYELLPAGNINDSKTEVATASQLVSGPATKTSLDISENKTAETPEKINTTETRVDTENLLTPTEISSEEPETKRMTADASKDAQKSSETTSSVQNSQIPKTIPADEMAKITEYEITQDTQGSNTPIRLPMGNHTGGMTPPLSQVNHRHSPRNGSPERSHSGGCHKFPDEESKAEYMKIKSEVTGKCNTFVYYYHCSQYLFVLQYQY